LVSRGIATVRIAGSFITAPIFKIDLKTFEECPPLRKHLRQLVSIALPVAFSGGALPPTISSSNRRTSVALRPRSNETGSSTRQRARTEARACRQVDFSGDTSPDVTNAEPFRADSRANEMAGRSEEHGSSVGITLAGAFPFWNVRSITKNKRGLDGSWSNNTLNLRPDWWGTR
jgi:hypothetical protein